jgi:CubicO group peptidase (beta-lactamase class C family)
VGLIVLAGSLGGPAASAQVPPPPPPPPTGSYSQKINTYLSGLTRAHKFNGAVLVASRGRVIANLRYGFQNYATHTLIGTASEFRLASVTKEFTAMGIYQLRQRGLLKTTDPMCTFVSGCPSTGWWRLITLRMLLDHTTGLPHDCGAYPEPPYPADPILTLVQSCIRQNKFLFRPGTKYAYSNTDFTTLGYIIEKASGERYTTYMKTHIWSPLGMTFTGIGSRGDFYTLAHPAIPYTSWGVAAPHDRRDEAAPAGGMYSTVGDMYRWDRGLDQELLLSHSQYRSYFTADAVTQCCLQGEYGNGWIFQTQNGRQLIWHNGGLPGVTTYNGRYPASCVDVIVLSNLQSANATQVGKTIGAEVPFTSGSNCGTS